MHLQGHVLLEGQMLPLQGQGNGAIDALLKRCLMHWGAACACRIIRNAVGQGAHARAMAYVELRVDGHFTVYGVGRDANIVSASMHAILSGLQRAAVRGES